MLALVGLGFLATGCAVVLRKGTEDRASDGLAAPLPDRPMSPRPPEGPAPIGSATGSNGNGL